ncbi:hypothetical protein Taro_039454, partial [Colocasia esculenta]|nr:hypothetical protein [Colocasia esculenta]
RDLRWSLEGVREVASFPAGSECELQECVVAVAECACFERGYWFARAAFGFVVSLRIRVGVSRRLREPTCGVAFIGAGLWSVKPIEGVLCLALRACALLGTVLCSVDGVVRAKQMLVCRVAPLVKHCDSYLWLLPALGWLVANSGEVLPEFFSVGSSGGEVFPRTVLCSFLVVAALPSGLSEGSSPSGNVSLLVKVFHCVTSLVEVSVVWFVTVALPSRLSCCATSRLRVGRFASFLAPCVLFQMVVWLLRVLLLSHDIWCHVAHRGDLCGEGPSPYAVLSVGIVRCVFCLCLGCAREALVTVWCVALLTYGGRSGALSLVESPFRLAMSRLLWRVLPVSLCCFGRWCNCAASCLFLVLVVAPSARAQVVCFRAVWSLGALSSCVASRVCSVFEALTFQPLGHFVLAVPYGCTIIAGGVAALPCLEVGIGLKKHKGSKIREESTSCRQTDF